MALPKKIFNHFSSVSSNLQDEIKKNAKLAVQSQLNRLDLISRDEFDIQTAVLIRSREKISALEQQITAMEKEITQLASESTS